MEFWFSELHTGNVKLSIKIEKQLFSGESEYQRIDVFDSEEFGKFISLDGEIVFSEKVSVPVEASSGRVCAEFVMCYPPGIPILAPGEMITDDVVQYILYAKKKGCSMQGTEDPAVDHLMVLANI